MSRRLASRTLHSLTLSVVAGAAALAPAAAVAADGSALDELDGPESSVTAEPPAEAPEDEETAPNDPTDGAPDDDAAGEEPPVDAPLAEEDEADEEGEDDAAPLDEAVEDEPIEPDTGYGKDSQPIRVGVSLAEGTYVPDGVTTAGSTLLITETGPNVEGGTTTTECVTEESTATEGSTATFCVLNEDEDEVLDRLDGRVGPLAVVFPENPDSSEDDQLYLADEDSTVTITQTDAPEGLVSDPEQAVVPPCEPVPAEPPFEDACVRQVALLEATGLPPEAADDTATTDEDTPVVVDVLANDDPVAGAPVTGFDVPTQPDHGMVDVLGSGEDTVVEYTPEPGYAGADSFDYSFSTPNGTASATVTLTVGTAAPAEPAEPAEPDAAAGSAALPDTGGADVQLVALGAALVLAGGALAVRRRRDLRTD